MLQQTMIERVRHLCHGDQRITAAIMYGSFAKGEGDEFSDIEFYLFLQPSALAAFDPSTWLAQIAPLALLLTNEFGTNVAIFENLVRGEFHFHPDTEISLVGSWGQFGEPPRPDRMLILDRTGELAQQLVRWQGAIVEGPSPHNLQQIVDRFFNILIFGLNVLQRGEHARALELLSALHRYLLWMARAASGSTAHWPTPSRALEADLPPEHYARFVQCVALLDPASLKRAYRAAWQWSKELMRDLSTSHGTALPETLIDLVDSRAEQWLHGLD